MKDKQKKYEVRWSKTAALALSKLFNIDHETVFIRSLTLLSGDPKAKAYGVANFPKFRFNGYYWTLINLAENRKSRNPRCYQHPINFNILTQ